MSTISSQVAIRVAVLVLAVVTCKTAYAQTPPYLTQWGSLGSGPGQFDDPEGVAIDPAGAVYVVDHHNHRIQKFTNTGGYLTQWGTNGAGNGQFYVPWGIVFDAAGNAYVTDRGNNRIQVFDSSLNYVSQWDGSSGGQLPPFGLPPYPALDAAGDVYVTDNLNRVGKYTSAGVFITGWGTPGSGNGQFSVPAGIGIDMQGDVYVADYFNDRIQKFTGNGVYLTQWPIRRPHGVAVGQDGLIYVTSTSDHKVQVFNSGGTQVAQWGSYGSGNGQFDFPTGIAVDVGGNIYVSDEALDRIQKFGPLPGVSVGARTFLRGSGRASTMNTAAVPLAQSFQFTVPGEFVSFDVILRFRQGNPSNVQQFAWALRPVVLGAPSTTVLDSGQFSLAASDVQVDTPVHVELHAPFPSVALGDKFAVSLARLTQPSEAYIWSIGQYILCAGPDPAPYSSGKAFQYNSSSSTFDELTGVDFRLVANVRSPDDDHDRIPNFLENSVGTQGITVAGGDVSCAEVSEDGRLTVCATDAPSNQEFTFTLPAGTTATGGPIVLKAVASPSAPSASVQNATLPLGTTKEIRLPHPSTSAGKVHILDTALATTADLTVATASNVLPIPPLYQCSSLDVSSVPTAWTVKNNHDFGDVILQGLSNTAVGLFDDPDGDLFASSVDDCPQASNPDQGPVVFGQDIVASARDTFSWPTPIEAESLRGDLAALRYYGFTHHDPLSVASQLFDAEVPPPGAGFYYLVRLGAPCEVGSWQSVPGAEPGRDVALPGPPLPLAIRPAERSRLELTPAQPTSSRSSTAAASGRARRSR